MTTKTMKHTPGPAQALDEALDWLLLAAPRTDGRERGDALKKHQPFIVRAVNSHDRLKAINEELVEALRVTLGWVMNPKESERISAIIAKSTQEVK